MSLADTEATLAALTDALVDSIEQRRGDPRPVAGAAVYAVDPVTVLPPREAFFAASETVATDDAVGRVSAELVAPYPPGIPVLAPGRGDHRRRARALRAAREAGVRIAYAADPTLTTLRVVS